MLKPGENNQILFLASSAPKFDGDPTAPFILNMARDLCDLGWKVDILVPHAHGLKKREIIEGVSIRRFQYLWPSTWQTLCYNGGAAINLKRNRFKILSVPFFVASELLAAICFIVRTRPAIIHSHWAIPQGVVGQILTLFGIPHVISVHGADIYGFRGSLSLAIKGWALRRCNHVIANSTSTRAEIDALCRPKSLSVIPTGTTPFAAVHGSAVDKLAFANTDTSVLLYVGRLIEAKGVRYLIEAMPAILARRHATLLIVGEGPERSSLERYARELNVSEAVAFVGPVPHSRIYDYFSLADVFVGPSIDIPGEWTEAQGNTFVEALFAKVPVVASRVGGIPDAIIHEQTGLLVDERSSSQIAESVLRVLSDASLARRLSESGYTHAAKNFSRETSAKKIHDVYREMLARPA